LLIKKHTLLFGFIGYLQISNAIAMPHHLSITTNTTTPLLLELWSAAPQSGRVANVSALLICWYAFLLM